ncbi:alpha/beta fold hydrolase [Nonomuraea sp. NPDC050663]|uniref:alpha/beta fold hydrolase n=1 Tax=Nonomuraea sp. NPDC050663 TaxID=3364370 RepID=UPI00379F0964
MSALDVPGATLYYEVRGSGPVVALVASPMGADAFQAVAEQLAADYTILTMDPRGHGRSSLADPTQDSTPELRADDLSRLLSHLDAGPAAVFGSSGGAVTVLALAQAHPEQVNLVIAHEPPLQLLVDDRDKLVAQTEDMIATFSRGDVLGAWSQFMTTANIHLPAEVLEMMFGGERGPVQEASDQRFFHHELRGTTRWRPDFDKLGRVPVVAGIGEDSTDQLCDRTTRALAQALGIGPTFFPGGHTGFADDPQTFLPRLRQVLEK